MKFTIDRSKWRCGGVQSEKSHRGKGYTYLLNGEGFLCCLGFVSEQLGVPLDDLFGVDEPHGILDHTRILGVLVAVEKGECRNTELTSEAVYINDSNAMTDVERERKLRALFIEHGHEIEFIGEHEKATP